MEETEVLTLLCKGDHIVEAMFTTWQGGGAHWELAQESATIPLGGNIDRIVFELPHGCFDLPTYGFLGSTLSIRPSGADDAHFDRPSMCERPHGFDLSESNVESSAESVARDA